MNDLVFLRHAATDMAGSFCGHSDPPINQAGEAQIRKLLEGGGVQDFDVCYSSDLARAMQTATAMAMAFDRPHYATPDLREVHFGAWEGLHWQEIESRDLRYARRWVRSFPSLSAPGGEDFQAFEERVLQTIDNLRAMGDGKTILVVTHAGVMRVVLSCRLGYDQQQAFELTKDYCSSFAYASDVVAEGSLGGA